MCLGVFIHFNGILCCLSCRVSLSGNRLKSVSVCVEGGLIDTRHQGHSPVAGLEPSPGLGAPVNNHSNPTITHTHTHFILLRASWESPSVCGWVPVSLPSFALFISAVSLKKEAVVNADKKSLVVDQRHRTYC